MAVQTINVGNIANDGTGDDLRDAFIKINSNFDELDLRNPDNLGGVNLGTGQGVFSSYTNGNFNFKSIASGIGITLADDGNTITVNADPQTITFVSDSGSKILTDGSLLTITGGQNVSTSIVGTVLEITAQTSLATDVSPELNTSLDANQNNITNVNLLGANNITSLIYGIDIRNIDSYFSGFDFGNFNIVDNFMDWIANEIGVDMGTFQVPATTNVDLGSI